MKTEAEIRVMQLQAKELQELLETPRSQEEVWDRFPLRASRNMKDDVSVVQTPQFAVIFTAALGNQYRWQYGAME